jgi:hypothetical protein
VEVKKRRGTYRKDRAPVPIAGPRCTNCGVRAVCEVEDFEGLVHGPYCEDCGRLAAELLGVPAFG